MAATSRQSRRQVRRKNEKLIDRWNILVAQRNIAVRFVIPDTYDDLFNPPEEDHFNNFLDNLVDGIKKIDDKTPKLGIIIWAIAYYKGNFDEMCEIIEDRLDKSLANDSGISVVILPMAITKSLPRDKFDSIFNRDEELVEQSLLTAKLQQPGILTAMLDCWKKSKNNYHRRLKARSSVNIARRILMPYKPR